MIKLRALVIFAVLILFIFVMQAMSAGQVWELKYKGDRYYVQNYSNGWLICEAVGDDYYYNEFEVPPGSLSRTYRIPDESFVVACGRVTGDGY